MWRTFWRTREQANTHGKQMTYNLKIFSAFLKSCDEKVITGHSCHGTIIKKNRVDCEKESNSPHLLQLLVKVSNNAFSVLIDLNSKKLHEVHFTFVLRPVSLLKPINFSQRVTREKYPDITTCLDSSCTCGSEECLKYIRNFVLSSVFVLGNSNIHPDLGFKARF